MHHGAEGAVRVQRIQVHLDDHLQRVPTINLPQCVHVLPSGKFEYSTLPN